MTTTNIVWLQNDHDQPLPSELRPSVALFTSEDACLQFVSSLPPTLRGLTLVLTDPTISPTRLLQLQQISTIYLLQSSKIHLEASSKIHGVFPDRPTLIDQILSDLNRSKHDPPGFVTGFLAPFQGFLFVLGHPSTWARALVPTLIFLLLLCVFAVPGVWLMHLWTKNLLERFSHRWIQFVGIWLLRLVLSAVTLFLSVIFALIIAQPLSAPALESLVRAQERELKYPNRPEEAFCASVCRSVRVAFVSILITILIFPLLTLFELFFAPVVIVTTPLKFIVTAFILAYDIIDYPLSLHYFGVRERTPWFRRYLRSAFGFGLAMELIFLIPAGFLIFLPAGVCGATILVVAAERAELDRPLLLIDDSL